MKKLCHKRSLQKAAQGLPTTALSYGTKFLKILGHAKLAMPSKKKLKSGYGIPFHPSEESMKREKEEEMVWVCM